MEIERKFLLQKLPEHLEQYPHHEIEQGYLCTAPVVRIRRWDDSYILTYKGGGMMVREEYEHPLTKESYEHLREKADGIVIHKTRYVIPLEASANSTAGRSSDNLKIELDIFHGVYEGLRLAEVEFPDEESANRFTPPAWFGKDVTLDGRYHNSYMSQHAAIQKLSQEELQALADRALLHIPKRAAHFAPLVGVQYGRITIRNQKTRWGSCSSKGNLNFNCLLMLAPEDVIDYVVVHELCHRLEMNHSHAFWRQVERVLPEYRTPRSWLKEHGSELMARNPRY